MQIDAQLYDGHTAQSHPVRATSDGVFLQVRDGERTITEAVADVRVVAPVGPGTWTAELPGGARLVFDDPEFAALVDLRRDSGWIDRLEGSWRWALVAIVVAVVGTWGILTWGLPAAAKRVAFSMPPHFETALSREGLDLLDRLLFDPSTLDAGTRARVERLFADITALETEYDRYRLEFRQSNIGPNAFALPGGVIVMTDEMVELAETDEELAAVLAHEVGHQAERHSLRIVLQDSITALFIANLTGDLTDVTALAASLPTALMQAKYSRDFEREADAFAFRYLEATGKDPTVLRELLLRLELRMGGSGDSWFSTHPQSDERAPE